MKYIYKLVKQFEDAVRWHEMRGMQRIEDQKEIEDNYKKTKQALLRRLKETK